MFVGYIMRLACHFNVIFFMVPSNNKRKLPTNNQRLETDPLTFDVKRKKILPKCVRSYSDEIHFVAQLLN